MPAQWTADTEYNKIPSKY